MDAIVLAGGLGTRLKPIWDGPKAMAPVLGRPFLWYVLTHLVEQNITRIILSVGYKYEEIRNYFGDGEEFGIPIEYAIEYEPLGTAGAVLYAHTLVNTEWFFVVNGDTMCKIDTKDLIWKHASEAYSMTALYTGNGIHTGVYVFNRDDVRDLIYPEDKSLKNDVLPRVVHNKVVTNQEFLDIGTPETYAQAETEILKWMFARQPFIQTRTNLGVIVRDHIGDIIFAADRICEALNSGNKVLWCGNGGSAAQCQHLSAELMGRLRILRQPLASISLTTDTSFLTAQINDIGVDRIFARQVSALGQPGDVLVAMSTSGDSKNVIEAVKEAQNIGMLVVGFTNSFKGQLLDMADIVLGVPQTQTDRCQEGHLVMGHVLCDMIEHQLFGGGWRRCEF